MIQPKFITSLIVFVVVTNSASVEDNATTGYKDAFQLITQLFNVNK